MAAAIASLLQSNPMHDFRIFVCSEKRNSIPETKMSAVVSRFGNATISFIEYNLDARREYLWADRHVTAASYIRLFLTEFLDPSIRRLLYLDADLIVNKDICELWQTDLRGAYLAAVPEPHEIPHDDEDIFYPYFNSGVLVIDVERWRAENLIPVFCDYMKANVGRLKYHDQDVLNHRFAGSVYLLEYRWNFQSRWADFVPEKFKMSAKDFNLLRQSPSIVHFTSEYKPWFYRQEPHYKNLYYQALALTPWRDYSPPDRTAKSRILKLIKGKRITEKLNWYAPATMRYLRRAMGI
jgi:lipopolysaccharide biosynthesis glycosyltransferase